MSEALPYTMSDLPRLGVCLASGVLPRVETVGSTYADYGSMGHAFCEAINLAGGPGNWREVIDKIADPRQREMLSAIPLEGLPLDPKSYAPEIALAWSVDTDEGRVLPKRGHRNYEDRRPREIAGTVDVVGLVGDDTVYVGDYKFLYGMVPGPKRNLQLKGYALAAARAFGRSNAIAEILRPREDEPPWIERATFDAFDLADVAAELRELAMEIDAARASGQLRFAVGPQCKYCKSFSFCDAQKALAVSLARGAIEMVPSLASGFLDGDMTKEQLRARADEIAFGVEAQLTGQNFPTFHHRLKAAEMLVEALRDTAKNFVISHGAQDLGNGLMYGERDWTEQRITGAVVWGVVRDLYSEKAAWAVSDLKVTQSSLKEKLARRVALERKEQLPAKPSREERSGASITGVVEEIRVKAAERGGWKDVTTKRVREFHKGEK